MTSSMTLAAEETDDAGWRAVAPRFGDFNFEQSAGYGEAAAARIGAQARYFVLSDSEGPLAAALIRLKTVPGLGRGIAWAPGGPLIHAPGRPAPDADTLAAALTALREQLSETEGHVLRVRPALVPAPPEGAAEAAARAGFTPTGRAKGYRTILVDVARDDDALLASFVGKWRTDLRAGWKAGVEIDRGSSARHWERYLAMHRQVAAKKGFESDLAPEFFRDLDDPDVVLDVLIAVHEGRDVGGITLIRTGPAAVYHYGATLPEGRRPRAGYVLAWEAMRLAREAGHSVYDLGGIDPDENPDVHRFKKRTGGTEATAPGPWEARPGGPGGLLLQGLEALHARLR